MIGLTWTIQKIDLATNTLENRINNDNIIYTKPIDVLKQLEALISVIPEHDIKYKISHAELTIGNLIYMKKGDYKIICEWSDKNGSNNYIVLISQIIKKI